MRMERFEVLPGLPATGPMYVPVSASGEPFYSEGFVVRFLPARSEPWIANFSMGLTDFSTAIALAGSHHVLVVAGGEAYLMDPERTKPLITFGGMIKDVLFSTFGDIVLYSDIQAIVVDSITGAIWSSDRICLDGLRNARIMDRVFLGEGWEYSENGGNFFPFKLDLTTRVLKGGIPSHPFDFHGKELLRSIKDL